MPKKKAPKKKTPKKKTIVVAVRFDADVLANLDADAAKLDLDRSEFIRWACASVGGARTTITHTVQRKLIDAICMAVADAVEDI